ncbi:hypothetical protein MD484_g1356, partial [Candolleomyces efflorescens]
MAHPLHQLIVMSPRDFEYPGYVCMNLFDSMEENELEEYYSQARQIIQEAGNIPLHLELSSPGMVERRRHIERDSDEDGDDSDCGYPSDDGEDALTLHHYESRPGLVEFIESTRGWEAAEINLGDHLGFAQDVFHCEPGQPPLETWMRLRSLSLISDSWNTPPEGEENYYCWKLRMRADSFPLLRAVTLHLKCCNVSGWVLPWAQLTSLTLEQLANALSWCLEVLGQCTALKTFNLTVGEIQDVERGNEKGERRVTVPRLEVVSIDISAASCDLSKGFFDKIQLPALKTLEIKGGFNPSSGPNSKGECPLTDSLRRCFRRSRCRIRHLSLEGGRDVKLKKEAIRRLLMSTPQLQSFDFGMDSTGVTRKYIESLGIPTLTEVTVDANRARNRERARYEENGYPYYSDSD